MTVDCPYCADSFEVCASREGSVGACPACAGEFVLRADDIELAGSQPVEQVFASAGEMADRSAAACPVCRSALSVDAVVCTACSMNLATGTSLSTEHADPLSAVPAGIFSWGEFALIPWNRITLQSCGFVLKETALFAGIAMVISGVAGGTGGRPGAWVLAVLAWLVCVSRLLRPALAIAQRAFRSGAKAPEGADWPLLQSLPQFLTVLAGAAVLGSPLSVLLWVMRELGREMGIDLPAWVLFPGLLLHLGAALLLFASLLSVGGRWTGLHPARVLQVAICLGGPALKMVLAFTPVWLGLSSILYCSLLGGELGCL